jgi:predicted dehydrogenase
MPPFPTLLPAPRTPDPTAAPPLRWGVLGTGWIANRFVPAVQRHTRQTFVAIASRDAGRAEAFARAYGLPRWYGSYDELASDRAVDVVYVATPHPAHLEGARLALRAGKHVLVEKPLALNAAQAGEIARLAADRGLFCMEALWTFFLPRLDVVRQILEAGWLGEVRTVAAELGEHFTAEHRIMRLDLAGGPLLDLGTYPLALVTWVLGRPERVVAMGQAHEAGVNGQLAAILADAHGNQGVVHTTLFSATPSGATIAGTRGTLHLPGVFCLPGDVVLTSADGENRLAFTEPKTGHGALYFQAAEVARCIAAGLRESPLRRLADSVVTLQAMDEIRRQLGIVFPGEG